MDEFFSKIFGGYIIMGGMLFFGEGLFVSLTYTNIDLKLAAVGSTVFGMELISDGWKRIWGNQRGNDN